MVPFRFMKFMPHMPKSKVDIEKSSVVIRGWICLHLHLHLLCQNLEKPPSNHDNPKAYVSKQTNKQTQKVMLVCCNKYVIYLMVHITVYYALLVCLIMGIRAVRLVHC